MDRREAQPVGLVGQHPMPAEVGGEDLLAVLEALLLARVLEPRATPGGFVALDDHRSDAADVGVDVRLEEPVLVLPEDEREGVEDLGGAEPGETRGVGVQGRREGLLLRAPHERVDPIGADEQVGLRQRAEVVHVLLEAQLDAQLARPPLEDAEQLGAPDGGEAVAVGADHLAAEVHVDGGPVRPRAGDGGEGRLVRVPQAAERLLGEHDAEAERGVGRVALDDDHLVARAFYAASMRCTALIMWRCGTLTCMGLGWMHTGYIPR